MPDSRPRSGCEPRLTIVVVIAIVSDPAASVYRVVTRTAPQSRCVCTTTRAGPRSRIFTRWKVFGHADQAFGMKSANTTWSWPITPW